MPIYAASEEEIPGITSDRLAEDINKLHPKLVNVIEDDSQLQKVLTEKFTKQTTIIVLGAGSISKRVKKCLT